MSKACGPSLAEIGTRGQATTVERPRAAHSEKSKTGRDALILDAFNVGRRIMLSTGIQARRRAANHAPRSEAGCSALVVESSLLLGAVVRQRERLFLDETPHPAPEPLRLTSVVFNHLPELFVLDQADGPEAEAG